MKYLSVAILLSLLAHPAAAERGQECATIKDNLSRLSCFDKAFEGMSGDTALDTDQAFAEFAKLANQLNDISRPRVRFDLRSPCTLLGQIINLDGFEAPEERIRAKYYVLIVDLKFVELDQLRNSVGATMNIVLDRGAEIATSGGTIMVKKGPESYAESYPMKGLGV